MKDFLKNWSNGFYLKVGEYGRYYVSPLKYIFLEIMVIISFFLFVLGHTIGLIILIILMTISVTDLIKISKRENSLSKRLRFD